MKMDDIEILFTEVERGLFNESLHPRGKGAQGGQFVSKGSSGRNDSVGYDSKKGTGAGYGSKGGDARVKQLQNYLNSLGFTDSNGEKLKVDGKLGPKTTSSIKRLQRKLGMKADGVVTPGLLGRLRRASARKKAGTYNAKSRQAAAAKKAAPKKAAAKKTPAGRKFP